MKKKLAVLVLVIGVGIWGYGRFTAQKKAQIQYRTEQAVRGTLIVTVTASGQVSTANSSPVTTGISGVVKKLVAKNGQLVKSGDALVEIDLDLVSKQKYTQGWSSYQSAKNSLDSTKVNLYSLQNQLFVANQKLINDAVARNLETSDPTYIEENATWLAAEATYKNHQNVINQSQTALNSAWLSYQQSAPVVYAPISGTLTGLALQIGSVIAPNDSSTKLAIIKTQAKPMVTVNLTQIDVSKVKIGDQATLVFDSILGKTYTGKVVSVDTSGVVSSGVTAYPTAILLDTGGEEILPNMGVNANIITQTKDDVIAVTSSAVQSQSGQATVRILVNGKINTVNVETGIVTDTQTEIVSGVAEGDMVVTSEVSTTTSGTTQTTSVFGGLGGGGFNRGGGNVRIGR